MDDSIEMAMQVCYNCKIRKRKCSKRLPSCELCTRLLLKCDYSYGTTGYRKYESTPHPGPPPESCTTQKQPGLNTSNLLLGLLNSSTDISPPASTVISERILDFLIERGESIPSVTATYFRTIDTWLPVISRERIQRAFEKINDASSPDLAILLLCMYMITKVPGNDSRGTMKSPLYFEVKMLFSIQASSGGLCIEMIQTGLLLSLYEHGHGMPEAAQMTLVITSKLGFRLMAIQRKAGVKTEDTELGHLWWGAIIMDKFMNLGIDPDEIHFSTGFQGIGYMDVALPVDIEASIEQEGKPSLYTPSGIRTTSAPTKLGPFCRTAEATQLLGKVLKFISASTFPKDEFELENPEAIDSLLQDLAMVLLRQATNGWEECCAAIGVCLSALLALHTRIWQLGARTSPETESILKGAEMAIRSTTRIIIDISRKFHMDRAYIDLPALPLQSTFCVYHAALLHIQFSDKEFLRQQWSSDMDSLKSTLGHFSKRWGIGKKYLEHIESAMAHEIQKRSINEASYV